MSSTDPASPRRVLGPAAYRGFLNPRRVAIIGASDDGAKSSGRPLRYLRRYGFEGEVFPINPTRSHVLGVPALPSLDSVQGELDLAVVLTSLYPGVTVLLARIVLGERMLWMQRLGLLLAAAGVILVTV